LTLNTPPAGHFVNYSISARRRLIYIFFLFFAHLYLCLSYVGLCIVYQLSLFEIAHFCAFLTQAENGLIRSVILAAAVGPQEQASVRRKTVPSVWSFENARQVNRSDVKSLEFTVTRVLMYENF